MSPTYISAAIAIITQVLPWLGINNVLPESLTTTVTTIVTIVAGIVILVRRLMKGDITILGSQKES